MAVHHLTNQYTDEALLVLMREGNSKAFDALYHRYATKIWGYFFKMLWKNTELAQDCTQELFIKLLNHAESFDAEKKFSTWIYSIAHNMCKNEYRKNEQKTKHAQMHDTNLAVTQKNPDLQKFKMALQRCLDQLDEERKTLYLLRFQEQITVPEISAIMQIPEGTVKSRLFHLVKELKGKLKAFENILTYP